MSKNTFPVVRSLSRLGSSFRYGSEGFMISAAFSFVVVGRGDKYTTSDWPRQENNFHNCCHCCPDV